MLLRDQLWVASPSESPNSRSSKVRIFRPFADDKPFNAVSRPVTIPDSLGANSMGAIVSGSVVPSMPDEVFLGHQSGHISIWSCTTFACTHVQRLSAAGVTAMQGLRDGLLWTGDRLGNIRIYDVRTTPWRVVKAWRLYSGAAVTRLIADPSAIARGRLQVLSSSLEGDVHVWDGLLSVDWMTDELESHVKDYSTFRALSCIHLTFNIDAATTVESEGRENPAMLMLSEAVATSKPEIIVVSLQELVDLQDKRVMAKSLLLGGGRRNKQDVGERVSHHARAWTERISNGLAQVVAATGAEPYRLILQDSLVGLYTAIFVQSCETQNVRDASIASVKTGFGGRMGNK